ncbi:MAG: hypothetical protein KGL39_00520 [Patescibacteria group bacterium]|nr:hypothetical protein [Patescibacteria group bacterium]
MVTAEQECSMVRRPGWGHPMTQKEIAEMFGVSSSLVGQVERRALEKLLRRPEIWQIAKEMGIIDRSLDC